MFLANRVGVATATVGTGTLTLGTALGAVAPNVASYQSFANGGITDQAEVPYFLLDANGNWEYGTGTYTLAGTTFTRTVIGSNNANAAINLSGSAQLFVGALATPGGDVLGGFPNPFRGFDTAINLRINASVGSNILTVAIKDNAGNDPSVNSPVYIPFRDPTVANGDPIWRRVTSALSITTNAVGASLGSVNGVAFRFWLVAFDNAGTVVLGLIDCSTANSIFSLNETAVASTTAMSASATLAGTFYTPNGTTLSSKAFRIIGYVEYGAGLATAGTYATGPTIIQLFGPGVKKPGDLIQRQRSPTGTEATGSGTFTINNVIPTNANGTQFMSQAITPSAAANILAVTTQGMWSSSIATGTAIAAALFQDAVSNALVAIIEREVATTSITGPMGMVYQAVANQTTSTTFKVNAGANTAATTTFNGEAATQIFGGVLNSFIQVDELMG